MITVISATNRHNSNTLKFAKSYVKLMEKQGIAPKLLSLEILPSDFASTDLYGKRSQEFQQIMDEYILPAEKYVFIVPEYNSSFPGVLKVFIDAMHPDLNKNKKVTLIGISTGRAGNLRGMDQLTSILSYIGMFVHPYKQPVSQVLHLLDADGNLIDENTIKILEKHIGIFQNW